MAKLIIIQLLVFLCLNPAFGQQPLGYLLNEGQLRDTVSFQNESNLIVIPIHIDGKGPYKFILDTGSESSIIFNQYLIKKSAINKNRVVPIYSGEGKLVTELLVARGLDVTFGGIRGKRQSMLVFQEYDLDIKNALGVDAVGILGSEIFNSLIVEVDYTNEKLIFHDPEEFNLLSGYRKVDIELKDSRPFIEVVIKQKGEKKTTVNLLVDSGASAPLFLDAENNENIKVPDKNLRHTVGNSLNGIIDGKVGRVQKLKIKPFTFKKVVASFPINWDIQKKLIDPKDDLIRYGTIGSDALSRFRVIYDYFNEVVYLKPNNRYKNDFRFNTIGFRVLAFGENYDQFFIGELIEKSNASKIGINIGDEIIAINGRPVSSFKFSEINDLLKAEYGTKTILILRRAGVLIKKVIKHKKLI